MARLVARKKRRGVALVEFALIVPLLIFLLLGIIEFGVLVLHQLTLAQAAREGSRAAAVRSSTATIVERITNSAVSLPNPQEMEVTLTYSTDNGQSFPYTLGDATDDVNDAPPGSLVQVTITCPHHLVTGSFFSWLTGAVDDTLPQQAHMVMRRE